MSNSREQKSLSYPVFSNSGTSYTIFKFLTDEDCQNLSSVSSVTWKAAESYIPIRQYDKKKSLESNNHAMNLQLLKLLTELAFQLAGYEAKYVTNYLRRFTKEMRAVFPTTHEIQQLLRPDYYEGIDEKDACALQINKLLSILEQPIYAFLRNLENQTDWSDFTIVQNIADAVPKTIQIAALLKTCQARHSMFGTWGQGLLDLIDQIKKEINTALTEAIFSSGQLETLNDILKKGANVNDNIDSEVIEFLPGGIVPNEWTDNQINKLNSPFRFSILSKNISLVTWFLDNGGKVDADAIVIAIDSYDELVFLKLLLQFKNNYQEKNLATICGALIFNNLVESLEMVLQVFGKEQTEKALNTLNYNLKGNLNLKIKTYQFLSEHLNEKKRIDLTKEAIWNCDLVTFKKMIQSGVNIKDKKIRWNLLELTLEDILEWYRSNYGFHMRPPGFFVGNNNPSPKEINLHKIIEILDNPEKFYAQESKASSQKESIFLKIRRLI